MTKEEKYEDVISKDDAIRIAEQGQVQGFEWQIKKLVTLPPVQSKPKTGHWIYDPETDLAKCDRCGAYCHSDKYGRIETPYCAMCGVKMVDLQKSEDEE